MISKTIETRGGDKAIDPIQPKRSGGPTENDFIDGNHHGKEVTEGSKGPKQ